MQQRLREARAPDMHLDDLWFKLRLVERIGRDRLEPRLADRPILILAGQGRSQLLFNQAELQMDEGMAKFAQPGDTFSFPDDEGNDRAVYLLHYEMRSQDGKPVSSSLDEGGKVLGPDGQIPLRCQAITKHWAGGPLERLRAQSVFQELLYDLLRQRGFKQDIDSRTALERTKAYIDEHYQENLTIERLARLAEVSPNYYGDLFKKTYGQNVVDYITDIRMRNAKRLMLRSSVRLGEVAREVGYQDEYYFSRKFKQNTGVSPSAYRSGRRRKIAAAVFPVIGQLLPLGYVPYAAPLHPKWTSFYHRLYGPDIPVHLSAYKYHEDWEANVVALQESKPDLIVGLGSMEALEKERLSAIAPVHVLSGGETTWQEQLRELAGVLEAAEYEADNWIERYEQFTSAARYKLQHAIGNDRILAISLFKDRFYLCPTRGMKEVLGRDLRLNLCEFNASDGYKVPLTLQHIAGFDADTILLNICQEPDTLSYWHSLLLSAEWQDLRAVRTNRVRTLSSDPWREYSAMACSRMVADAIACLCGDDPATIREMSMFGTGIPIL